MIHLKLTHQDADCLHRSLTRLQLLSPDDDARYLIDRLQQAQREAPLAHNCLSCNTAFYQDAAGRHARYCSNTCKQKAYRQRVNDRKRQFGPNLRT